MTFPSKIRNKITKASVFLKKESKKIIVIALILLLLTITCVPSTSFRLGNIFFGNVKQLYNLKLAKFFYKLSAYPVLPIKEPRYAHYQLARTYFIEGNLYGSLLEGRKELEIYPEDTLSYYLLGLTSGYLNLTEEAIDYFSKYIEKYPTTWAAKNDKAWLQFRNGDIHGALLTVEIAALSQPSNPWLANTYGVMLMNSGKLQEAKESFERGLNQANLMTENDWGYAYPGNDPRVYEIGLTSMRKSFADNLKIVNEKLKTKNK